MPYWSRILAFSTALQERRICSERFLLGITRTLVMSQSENKEKGGEKMKKNT
jgi:hypothetical protein